MLLSSITLNGCKLYLKTLNMASCTSAPIVSSYISPKTCFLSSTMIRHNAVFSNRLSTPSKLSNLESRFPSHARLLNPRTSMIPVTPAPNVTGTTMELNVTIDRSSLVTPSAETKRTTLFLSNMDQGLNFMVGMVFFFTKNHEFPPETVAETLETAFGKLLVPYDFVAGRLRVDHRKGRFEIDSNSAGAGFVVASSESSLEELGDLVTPNPQYQKLASRELLGLQANNQPLFILQITSFKCGGFAMGILGNHMLFDGVSYKIFLENLALLAGNKPIGVVPQNDRRLLSARSPPRVTFNHPELFKLDNQQHDTSIESPFSFSSKKLQSKAFRLSAENIKNLRDKGNGKDTKATDFIVIVAHIWQCISLAKKATNEQDTTSSLAYTVNMRSRLRPRLPSSYTGNAVYAAYCRATYTELEKGSFAHLVQIITRAEKQVTDDYIRSGIDWKEINKGFMYSDIIVTSWWKLGFNDVMYPWGKPGWISPVHNNENVAVVLLPDFETTTANPNGVTLIVSLQTKEMEKFEHLFNRCLENNNSQAMAKLCNSW